MNLKEKHKKMYFSIMQVFTASKEEISNLTLNEIESKHCVRVLRKKNGDTINVTDGQGSLYECIITDAHQKKCSFSISKTTTQPLTCPPLHLVVAPTKNIDRFEFFLEKATEIGVQKITPLLAAHSERKKIKQDRLDKIVISACKQSKNFHFPKLHELTAFKDILKTDASLKLIAHCEDQNKKELKEYSFNQETIILIGPEGDFSPSEIKQALDAGFKPVSLGKSRLRTETAGIVACTTVNLNYE